MSLVSFLFCFTKNIHAQKGFSPEMYKMKSNCVKIGTTSLIKYYLSYEHAVAKHFSAGIMASYNATTFTGYTGTVFTRFYFNEFNESGWFLEAKGSYAYYNPKAYTDSHYWWGSNAPYPSNLLVYTGEHKGHVNYLYAGISGGYKFFFSKHSFFECLAGLHYGKATFGKNDTYMEPLPGMYGADIKTVFYNYGPGFPFHFMINFGFDF